MAVVKLGSLVHSLRGKIEGSFFRNNTYGVVLQSNNWSKRGLGIKASRNKFDQSSLATFWRSMSPGERQSWYDEQKETISQTPQSFKTGSGSSGTK